MSAADIRARGPLADDLLAFFGCYDFSRHVGTRHLGQGLGLAVAPLLAAVREEFRDAALTHARGCGVRTADRSGFAAALACARAADLVVAVVGDESGLFGRGTSGEGCDAVDLCLPGVQGHSKTRARKRPGYQRESRARARNVKVAPAVYENLVCCRRRPWSASRLR